MLQAMHELVAFVEFAHEFHIPRLQHQWHVLTAPKDPPR